MPFLYWEMHTCRVYQPYICHKIRYITYTNYVIEYTWELACYAPYLFIVFCLFLLTSTERRKIPIYNALHNQVINIIYKNNKHEIVLKITVLKVWPFALVYMNEQM